MLETYFHDMICCATRHAESILMFEIAQNAASVVMARWVATNVDLIDQRSELAIRKPASPASSLNGWQVLMTTVNILDLLSLFFLFPFPFPCFFFLSHQELSAGPHGSLGYTPCMYGKGRKISILSVFFPDSDATIHMELMCRILSVGGFTRTLTVASPPATAGNWISGLGRSRGEGLSRTAMRRASC